MNNLRPHKVVPKVPGLDQSQLAVPFGIIERAPTTAPLSDMQLMIATLIGVGVRSWKEIARSLHISPWTARTHAQLAAQKIPGDLPCQSKLAVWVRGGTRDVLEGHSLRYQVEIVARPIAPGVMVPAPSR